MLPAGGSSARRRGRGHAGRRPRTPFPSGTADGRNGAAHPAQLFFAWGNGGIVWPHGRFYRRPHAAGGGNEAEPPYRRRASAGTSGAGTFVRGHGGAGGKPSQRGMLRHLPECSGGSTPTLLRDPLPGRTVGSSGGMAELLAGFCPAGAGSPSSAGRIHPGAGLSLSGLPGWAAATGRTGLHGHQPKKTAVCLSSYRHGQERRSAFSGPQGHGGGKDRQASVPDRPEYGPAESHSGVGANEGAGPSRPGQRADGPGKALPGGNALPSGLLPTGAGTFSPTGGRCARSAGRLCRRMDGRSHSGGCGPAYDLSL